MRCPHGELHERCLRAQATAALIHGQFQLLHGLPRQLQLVLHHVLAALGQAIK
ncbi:hypothetical protein D3C85_1565570 [compost metagenome]